MQIPESELLDTVTNDGSRCYVHVLRTLTLEVRVWVYTFQIIDPNSLNFEKKKNSPLIGEGENFRKSLKKVQLFARRNSFFLTR